MAAEATNASIRNPFVTSFSLIVWLKICPIFEPVGETLAHCRRLIQMPDLRLA
jgi:hypothetical protein